MNILFINGSPNRDGNTAALAARFLQGHTYETLNLTDYRINVYGQELPGDQFSEVLAKIRVADRIVIGSPLYWHNICGFVRTLLCAICWIDSTVLSRRGVFTGRLPSFSKVQHLRSGCWRRANTQCAVLLISTD